MVDHDPRNQPEDNLDAKVTSTFPAGHTGDGADRPDADSWVAQWSGDPARLEPQAPVTPTDRRDAGVGPSQVAGQPKPSNDAAEIAAWQKAQERHRRRAKLRTNQKRAKLMKRDRPRPDEIQAARPVQVYRRTDRGGGRRLVAVGAAALVALLGVVGYVLISSDFGIGGAGDDRIADGDNRSTEDLVAGADLAPRGIQELALSTVQLVGLNQSGQPECAGSGVIVTDAGTILTNAHVVSRSVGCEFTTIAIGVAANSTASAQLLYRAEVLAVDTELDLAVLRVAGWLDPAAGGEFPTSFPRAPLGDSDTVGLGDDVRILGFPVIGGDTITLTTGSVSGFTAQEGIGTRALIKTDATISAGNSGGMALDAAGRVIGIPTKARASENGPAIDCRPLADTNDDGTVDAEDNCVPVGGFLNGIRPINLALPLLQQAISDDQTSDQTGPAPDLPVPNPDFDIDSVTFSNPRFAMAADRTQPIGELVTSEAGIAQLCFFVDWSGMPSGTAFEGAWFIDGVHEPNFGDPEEPWNLAEQGRNFWVCATDRNANGLPAGSYEIGFFLEGQLAFAEGITITDGPVDVVTVTWVNDTGVDLCGLAVNPLAVSGQVGLSELALDESIPPGGTRSMDLPLGNVVVEAYDCDGVAVADASGGLAIIGPEFFSISR